MDDATDVLRVQFIHGLEGSPSGNKAKLFARTFDAQTPAMDTSDFEGCVRVHAEVLRSFEPDVLVGSSFGGAVALALLQSGAWRGPTLLLAQAGVRRGMALSLPADVDIWIVHGVGDALIDIEDSRRLAACGDAGWVRLIEVDDDHALHESTRNGSLEVWVRELAARTRSRKAALTGV